MIRLGVNIDHIATLRQARRGREPDPIAAAVLAELSGADGIVAHLREDRRHMQDRDIRLLREVVATHLNLEMASTEEMVRMAQGIRPDLVTLVPERREELTTEGGLDVIKHLTSLQKTVGSLQEVGIGVSLFIDPDCHQIDAAHKTGAEVVEIHTGRFAGARSGKDQGLEWAALQHSATHANKTGFSVSAGHGLNYRNVRRMTAILEIEELNIGHSIISRASLVGIERAVREMKDLLHRPPTEPSTTNG